MFEPTNVVVWARNDVCADPETGARLQYIPDDGAAGTSGAVLGSASGGNAVCAAAPRAAPLAAPTRETACGGVVPGRAAIAEVDRSPVGRRVVLLPLPVSLPLPAEESCRSRAGAATPAAFETGSPFSVLLGCRAEMGVVVLEEKEACEAERVVERDAEAGAEPAAADDCDRWRIESSEG